MSISSRDEMYLHDYYIKHVKACPICKGSGAPCECRRKYKIEVRMALANIPLDHRHLTFNKLSSPYLKKAKEDIKWYMSDLQTRLNDGMGLMLKSEETGTGKTSLGIFVLRQAVIENFSAYFTTLENCIDLTTSGWYDESKRREFEEKILETQFLVIDDLGGREISTKGNVDLKNSRFTTLFKERSDNRLPTIITTNLSMPDIQRRFGGRVHSAILGCLKPVDCTGADFRKQLGDKLRQKGRT